MFCARHNSYREHTSYATGTDFHQVFEQDMNRLYLLSLLLTANHSLAEMCFVRGLDDSSGTNRVFKDWLHSWAKRTIVQNAIQIIQPRPGDLRVANQEVAIDQTEELAAITELPPFERFVFVLSVLERYSDQECTLLLRSSRSELIAAKTRALESIGSSAQRRQASKGVRGHRAFSA